MHHESLKDIFTEAAVSPYEEMLAYENLYALKGMSLKKIADLTVSAGLLPSQALTDKVGLIALSDNEKINSYINTKMDGFSVAVKSTPSWPQKLNDSERPSPLLYYKGDIGLLESPCVSVVGTRKPTPEGISRAFKIAKELTAEGIVVVTGLAAGIDTAATYGALNNNGSTISVIGTPIDEYYPKENRDLQDRVAAHHLLLSQVPFFRYSIQPFGTKKYYFPERNELMAAITDATIIVEASDTSGTLTQARACLKQRRPLFIMKSCLQNEKISWPKKYINKPGVQELENVSQVIDAIKP